MPPINPIEATVAGVSIVGVINAFVDFVKPSFPHASGNVWRWTAFFLGVLGVFVEYGRQTNTLPPDFGTWVFLVILGLMVGITAGVAYDTRQKRKLDALKKQYPLDDRALVKKPGIAGHREWLQSQGAATLKLEAEAEVPEGVEPREVMEEMASQIGVQYSGGRLVQSDTFDLNQGSKTIAYFDGQGQPVNDPFPISDSDKGPGI